VDDICASSPSQIAPAFEVASADLELHALGRRCGEMVIEMELGFHGRLDPNLLARAADLLLDAEPVLGCRLVVNTSRVLWQHVPRSERRLLTITEGCDEYERVRRAGLDASANVQLVLCLWRHQDGDRLLVKMTHEVGDGVGLQFLVTRLSSIYSALCTNPAYRVERNLKARRDRFQILSQLPKRAYLRILWDFVKFMAPRWFPRATHRLPLARESTGPWVPVIKRVPATHFSSLSKYAKERGATLNDLFLSAAYRALASCGNWDGRSGLRICMTVDLRRWSVSRAPVASICNLSSLECPFLVRNLGRDFEETLANVTALTRMRKKRGLGLAPVLADELLKKRGGYARLRRAVTQYGALTRTRTGHSPTVWETASAVLSNEGALDKIGLRFGTETPVSVHILPPFLAVSGVHVSMSSYYGAFTLAAVTTENRRVVVKRFLDCLIEQLPIGAASTSTP
jgi:NRPS condensation-like uncharacterized protein